MADEEKALFVKSAIKDLIKAQGCKTSSDLVEKKGDEPVPLNDTIKGIIVQACKRATENKRTTVYPRDL